MQYFVLPYIYFRNSITLHFSYQILVIRKNAKWMMRISPSQTVTSLTSLRANSYLYIIFPIHKPMSSVMYIAVYVQVLFTQMKSFSLLCYFLFILWSACKKYLKIACLLLGRICVKCQSFRTYQTFYWSLTPSLWMPTLSTWNRSLLSKRRADSHSSHSHNYIGLSEVILLLGLLIHSHLFDVFHI